MKTIRRIVAALLACVMVMSSFTITFAKSSSSSSNLTRYYNHIGIAVVTEDGKYSLKEKPSVWYYNGDEKVKISLNNMYLSGKNGKEYQSSSRWSFTNNTKFYIEAVLTDGKNDRVFRADIVNTSNYNKSGLSFYEYCAKNYCDDKMGIDMKLIVEELAETTKYTVTYSDGGVGVEVPVDNNLYLTGDKVTVADDVMSKDMYDFKGWSYNGNIYKANDKITVGNEDIVLTAVWKNLYKISYVVEGNEVGYKIVEEGTNVSDLLTFDYEMPDVSKEILGWEADASDETVKSIDKDIVVTAKTATKTFTVTYKVDGKTVETFNNVPYNSEAPEYKYTPAEGYNFSGWTNVPSKVTEDVVINGTTEIKKFTVTYKVDGKVVKTFDDVTYGSEVPEFEYNADKAYDFTGWTNVPEKVTDNLEINGTTEIKKFTVTYKVNGITVETFKNVTYGSKAPEYNYTVAEGYNFSGWLNVPEEVTEDVVINGTTEIKKFTVTYKVDGKVVKTFDEVTYGSEVPGYEYEVSEGYNFSGWLNVPEKVTDNLEINGTTEIKKFTVTYKVNGKIEETLCDVEYGSEVPGYEYEVPEGYNFSGWLNVPEKVTDNIEINGTTEIKKFTVTYTVDGEVVDEFTVEYGSEVPASTYEVPEGYKFSGFELASLVEDTATVKQDMVFVGTAEIMTFTVTYTVDGEVVDEFTVEYGSEVPASTYEVAEGYDFTGFELVTEVEDATVVKQDMVFAGATELKRFTVIYKVNDEVVDEFTVEYGSEVPASTYEVPEGYDFSGWSNTPEKVTEDLVIVGTTELKTFKITYILNNEEYYATTAKYGEEHMMLGSPAGESENFSGWTYVTGNLQKITEDVVLVGSTTIKEFTVTYTVDGEVVDEFTVEYGSEVPASTYEVPEGYKFSGFELVTEVEDANAVKENMVFAGTTELKTFTVTYTVDGEVVDEFTVEYGSEVPASTYEVAEGYEFTGFELVTEVEDATVVKQDMVFEGTTSLIVVEEEEEEDVEIDTPFVPGTIEDKDNDVDKEEPVVEETEEEEEDIDLDTPFAPGTTEEEDDNLDEEEPTVEETEEEEEDINVDTPFDSGAQTGDTSDYSTYVAILLIAAVGAMVVAYNKKRALN